MFSRMKRYLATFRGEPVPDALTPVQPRVTPDPRQAEALARRWAELNYYPENGFHAHQRQDRSNVVQFPRRRAR